jgi:hypothetical protein
VVTFVGNVVHPERFKVEHFVELELPREAYTTSHAPATTHHHAPSAFGGEGVSTAPPPTTATLDPPDKFTTRRRATPGGPPIFGQNSARARACAGGTKMRTDGKVGGVKQNVVEQHHPPQHVLAVALVSPPHDQLTPSRRGGRAQQAMDAYLRQILVRAPSFTNTRWGSTSWSPAVVVSLAPPPVRPSAHPPHQWSIAPSVRTTKPNQTKTDGAVLDPWSWPYRARVACGREEEVVVVVVVVEEEGVRWARWVPTRGCP